ncbi:MAG: hypothetical protein K0M70_06565 [Arenimonas sp.]|uniref:hypothetical protein n=1 Tax=Arenimonas sp. TaxID=1872635 RepID=UPI0025BB92FC|nr:hypothetical protein [Arenimonas sp.]MBW8367505.1 hypothetical protein [Arenimonas sp.]
MKALRLFALPLLLTLLSCGAIDQPRLYTKVLFVGNSLTYVGNVPAVYSALAQANGHDSPSDMIVRAGATLSQRVGDGSVARALEEGSYTHLVVQERGGDLMCSFGAGSCTQAREAVLALADVGRRNGAVVLLLGTYQSDPSASRQLIESESEAARNAGIPYIEVSGRLQRLRGTAPELSWFFAADDFHPGRDLALLNALLVYHAIHGELPQPGPLTVKAPIYGSTSGLDETLRNSDAPPPLETTPIEVRYDSAVVEKLLDSLVAPSGD